MNTDEHRFSQMKNKKFSRLRILQRRRLFAVLPFHFKQKETVAEAVRRLCCRRIDEALEALKASDPLNSVHKVRKEIKNLRAVL